MDESKELERLDALTERTLKDIQYRQANPDLFRPILTHLDDLDELIGGLMEAEFTVIGGKAKVGKSSILLHLAMAIATSGRGRVDYYSLEEMKRQMAIRALTKQTKVTNRTMIRKLILQEYHLDELQEAHNSIADANIDLWIADNIFTPEEIIERTIAPGSVTRFIAIDYLQLMMLEKEPQKDYLKWDKISAMLLRARNEYGIGIIMTYQIGDNDMAYGTRSIYKDADLLIEVDRKVDKITEKEEPESMTVKILRSRVCGSGKCELGFDPAHSRVHNYAKAPGKLLKPLLF